MTTIPDAEKQAVRSIDDGKRLIAEMGVGRQWAIYLLDAEWTVDTRPSQNGWWHALVRDVVVLREVFSSTVGSV